MKVLPWILIVLLALAVLFLWNRQQELSGLPHPDTTEYVETIPFYYPVPRDSVIKRYKTVKLPIKKDSCEVKQDTCILDSAEAVIPITQKIYEDNLYRAWCLAMMQSWIVLKFIVGHGKLENQYCFQQSAKDGD